MLKRYKSDLKDTHNPISTLIPTKSDSKKQSFSVGLNSEATKELQQIFNEKKFDYSKPRDLIQFFVDQICNTTDIVLDSFAGSGTTGHAVLNLNKKDGGNRKFICIEMEDYADSTTAARIKRRSKDLPETKVPAAVSIFMILGSHYLQKTAISMNRSAWIKSGIIFSIPKRVNRWEHQQAMRTPIS